VGRNTKNRSQTRATAQPPLQLIDPSMAGGGSPRNMLPNGKVACLPGGAWVKGGHHSDQLSPERDGRKTERGRRQSREIFTPIRASTGETPLSTERNVGSQGGKCILKKSACGGSKGGRYTKKKLDT